MSNKANFRWRPKYLLFLTLLLLSPLESVWALTNPLAPKTETGAATPTKQETAPDIAAIREEIEQLENQVEAIPAGTNGDSNQELRKQLDLARQLAAAITEHELISDEMGEFAATIARLNDQLKELETAGLEQDPPYSITSLDELREKLVFQRQQVASAKDNLQNSQDVLETSVSALKKSASDWRKAKEASETNGNPDKSAVLALKLTTADYGKRAAAQSQKLQQLKVEREKRRIEVAQQHLGLFEAKLHKVKPIVDFAEAHLSEIFDRLDDEKSKLNKDLGKGEVKLRRKRGAWLEAKNQLREGEGPDKASKNIIASLNRQKELLQKQAFSLKQRMQRLEQQSEMWQWRFDLFNTQPSAKTIKGWKHQVRQYRETLDNQYQQEFFDVGEARKIYQSRKKESAALKEADPAGAKLLWTEYKHNVKLVRLV